MRSLQLVGLALTSWLFDRLRADDVHALERSLAAMRQCVTQATAIVPSSDPYVFATLPTTLEAAWPAVGDPPPAAKKQPQQPQKSQKNKREKTDATEPV